MADLLEGDYEPAVHQWVRDQVAEYEASGGTRANTLRETGIPVVVITMMGAKSGKLRKIVLMRVEHEGKYALVASKGGAPDNPKWVANLAADDVVQIQDGADPGLFRVHEAKGAEYDAWWERSAAVYPEYDEYQKKTDRKIPVFVAEPLYLLG